MSQIYDRVESSVGNLKSVGIIPDSYCSLLALLLTEKLPSELRMIIARKFSDEIWNLEKLMNHFNNNSMLESVVRQLL